jgi:hypothetical protein
VSASRAERRGGRGLLAGIAAGIVALGCCVGPAVATLIGITSGAFALDLATDLYAQWGWAFKIGGAAVGALAVARARSRARACTVEGNGLMRFAVVVTLSGLATYGALYGVTTWLGGFAN